MLGEMIVVLIIYWEKHCDWAEEEEQRFDCAFFSLRLILIIC